MYEGLPGTEGARAATQAGRVRWRPRSLAVRLAPALLVAVCAFLLFYNLDVNPRPWHDEGAALSVARTLAEDGYYGVRTSEGYQTFGPVQSVGPTILLPIALSFRLFGVGLVQGRAVVALYALATLVLIYGAAARLFGRLAGWIAVLLVISSPTVSFVYWSRQALAEVPALGLFLAGWLVWSQRVDRSAGLHNVLAGLLWGAAIVTKSGYLITIIGTAAVLAVLDLRYYRSGALKGLVLSAGVALACVGAWWAWQELYYGRDTFQANAVKMALLAGQTSGFSMRTSFAALQSLVGSSAPLYDFWFIPASARAVWIALRRGRQGLTLGFLVVFAAANLSYYVLMSNPWAHYALGGMVVLGIFVGGLLADLLRSLADAWRGLVSRLRAALRGGQTIGREDVLALGTLAALVSLLLLSGDLVQSVLRVDVLDSAGLRHPAVHYIPQLQAPEAAAAVLNGLAGDDAVIETWERELSVLTALTFHYPDQSLLAPAHAATYRGGPRDYALGEDYFREHSPDLVVVGWYARSLGAYDLEYLATNADLVATVGEGEWRYDIFRFPRPFTQAPHRRCGTRGNA